MSFRSRPGLGYASVVGAAALLAGALGLIVATVVAGSGGGSGSHSANELALPEGVEAPEVVLPATTGQTIDVTASRGKRDVLLYFYEHAG